MVILGRVAFLSLLLLSVLVGAAGWSLATSETASGPATCGSESATIVGTPRADAIVGTRRSDVISSGRGDDEISGRQGRDLICSGPGEDQVRGNRDHDTLRAGDDDDLDGGGRGDDLLAGDLAPTNWRGCSATTLCSEGADTTLWMGARTRTAKTGMSVM